MTAILTRPDTQGKLELLSADAQYDLACACGTKDPAEHRKRGEDGRWVYPVTLPSGGTSVLFKTLVSNACSSDCKYCPLRQAMDSRRCTLSVDETVTTFLDYLHRGKVFGLFLSSGLTGSADAAMDRLVGIARTLRRRHQFRGYIHLKVLPGASAAAVEEAVSVASAVSLNIETPGAANLRKLSHHKDYQRDIIEPIKLISRLTAKGSRHARVRQTTQFIVGAAGESDSEIVRYMYGLYDRLHLQRIYFSAYQQGLGDSSLSAERTLVDPREVFTREHRLYQVDFLFRRYGFTEGDIACDAAGRLPLTTDPKQAWADAHPEFFPVDINRADKFTLLRVPGLGPTSVQRILKARKESQIRRLEDFTKPTATTRKAMPYLRF